MDFFVQVAQFVHAPGFLMLLSIIRTVVAVHYRSSVQSSVALNFLYTYSMHVLTAIMWQCYFANSLASIKGFLRYWECCTSRQQILFLSLAVPAILCAPFFVTSGLLEFTHGLPPSVPMLVVSFLPALLWTIPVALNSAVGLFQAENGVQLRQMEQMQQMQEVVIVHLVNLTLYCVFLKNSEGDTMVGSSGITTVGMLGVAFIGFVLQFIHTGSHRPHGRWNENVGQCHVGVDRFREPQANGVVEFEEQSTLHSELALLPKRQVSTEHKPVISLPHNPPRVIHREHMVIHTGQASLSRYRTAMEFFIQVVQFVHHVPSLLMLLSIIRTVMALHYQSNVQSSVALNSLCTYSVHVLTAIMWQCYFANSLASIKGFLRYWECCTSRQQILFLSLAVPAILCAPFFVTSGLLEFTHGLPPSVPMLVVSFLPALLWTIPVALNSAVGLFQAENGVQLRQMEQMQQMQEVVIVHLVNLTLYCVFLKNSEGDTMVGSSGITTVGMLGVAFIGFVLQFMYMWSHKLFSRDVGQEHVTPLPYIPPRVPHREELVVHSDNPLPLRRIPDAVCRFSARVHSFVAVL